MNARTVITAVAILSGAIEAPALAQTNSPSSPPELTQLPGWSEDWWSRVGNEIGGETGGQELDLAQRIARGTAGGGPLITPAAWNAEGS